MIKMRFFEIEMLIKRLASFSSNFFSRCFVVVFIRAPLWERITDHLFDGMNMIDPTESLARGAIYLPPSSHGGEGGPQSPWLGILPPTVFVNF